MLANRFDQDGYVVIKHLISNQSLYLAQDKCSNSFLHKAGSRNLLDREWVQDIAAEVLDNPNISELMPDDVIPVQCTYFEKNTDKNWLVSLHRDKSIPVRDKFEGDGWNGWSVKQGINFVQPPTNVLESLVAVRVHLEDNTIENGALKVIPGSHKANESKSESVVCDVTAGGALVMRPLLLHSSSKLQSGRRRVLHFLFGPKELPGEAEWYVAEKLI